MADVKPSWGEIGSKDSGQTNDGPVGSEYPIQAIDLGIWFRTTGSHHRVVSENPIQAMIRDLVLPSKSYPTLGATG